eukprot:NODE_9947_length_552_cov_32.801865_g9305_i0.p1 GENE.NODE_9947_length_552_cov_32.801865_g9305_i0~~NODE_9947_length_552_cov_32.801865_g9305_i0.p1  ORF type:complete len:162 (-),score=21.97 NODE_9947_length_552_cov_32.801865_g9305_i0:14-499(-)
MVNMVDTVLSLQRVKQLQSHRAATYVQIERAHDEWTNTRNLHAFREICNDCTLKFQQCSASIVEVENELKSAGHIEYANLIRQLQEKEKIKLQLSVQFWGTPLPELSHQCGNHNKDDQLLTEFEMYENKKRQYRAEIANLIVEINEILEEIQCELSSLDDK